MGKYFLDIYSTYFEMKAVSGRMTEKNTSRATDSVLSTVFSTRVRAYLNHKQHIPASCAVG